MQDVCIYLSITVVAKSNELKGLKSSIIWRIQGTEIQGTQLASLLESHKAESKALAGLLSLLETPGKNLFLASSRWQTGFSMCGIRVSAALLTASWSSSISKISELNTAH